MEILEGVQKEMNVIESIQEKLFDVKLLQLHPNVEGFNSPDNFGVYKTTGGESLGVVGNTYKPVNAKQVFASLTESLIDNNIGLSELKYETMKDDRKIRFSVPIKTISFKNPTGLEDETIISLNLQTGFDGRTKTSLYLSSYRLICLNGMKIRKTEFSVAIRNTKGNTGKIECLTKDVVKIISSANNYEELMVTMNETEVTKKQQNEYIKNVFGMEAKDYKEWSTKKQNQFDAINRSVGLELDRTGRTVFGLLNGITHYTNHVASAKNRLDYILVDSGRVINENAQKFAMQLLN